MFMYQDKFKTNYIFGNLFRSLSVSESPIVVVSQACKDDPSTSHRKSTLYKRPEVVIKTQRSIIYQLIISLRYHNKIHVKS